MENPDHPDHVEVDQLLERSRVFCEKIEERGFYISDTQIAQGPIGHVAVMWGIVGDVAMTQRVQDPVSEQFDAAFAEIAQEVTVNSFLDERERIRREGFLGDVDE